MGPIMTSLLCLPTSALPSHSAFQKIVFPPLLSFCYKRRLISRTPPAVPSASLSNPPPLAGFTLVEVLAVLLIISIALAFLVPALSPNSGRALEGDARILVSQLENARLTAIAKRTKTRVLIASTNNWGTDHSWRAYVLATLDSTTGNWLQQGKFTRLSSSTTFDSATGVIQARSSTTTNVVKAPNATPTPVPSPFVGAYVEFNPTGSTSLDPSATPELIRIQNGFVPTGDSSPTPIRKNQSLLTDISIDPLTGSAILK